MIISYKNLAIKYFMLGSKIFCSRLTPRFTFLKTLINMPRAFSNKEILQVAYPILISLIMEQLIGMTDTAFLGRVGEVELGASAIGGIFGSLIHISEPTRH